MELFGFEIKRKNEENKNLRSFAEPNNDDGAVSVTATGGAVSSFIDLEGTAKSEAELVQKYRGMMQQPEVQMAVDDIVNESINITYDSKPVECVTDDVDLPDNIKKRIREEFDNCLRLLDFSNHGYDIFTKWYVDGRLNFHVMIDEKQPKRGILELRYIDPRKLRKIREFDKERSTTKSGNSTFFKRIKNEYYIYNEKGFHNTNSGTIGSGYDLNNTNAAGLRIARDSIVNCNSGLLNENTTLVLSHLHKAHKPLNQLRIMEDAVVIYRISRAPERRIFYIDVGNLPKNKAEQYLRDMMARHKNKLQYNSDSGQITDSRKMLTMTEDFWFPRRGGERSTEVDTLAGGNAPGLSTNENMEYFQRKLFKSLKVPLSRLEPEAMATFGRTSEITRDELKFGKFIRRIRTRFSWIFSAVLEKQLVLKGILTPEEFNEIRNDIRYDFVKDNYFEELKETEILRERLNTLRDISDYTGKYFSHQWITANVLQMTEEQQQTMEDQIADEMAQGGHAEDDAF